jgi:hypothetical protein
VGETAANGGYFKKRRSRRGVDKEYTKSGPFFWTGIKKIGAGGGQNCGESSVFQNTADIAGRSTGAGTSALPPARPAAATAMTFWKWTSVSRVYTPLLRWLLEMGPKWCGKVPKEFTFQKQPGLAARSPSLTVPSAGSWLCF